MIFDQTHLPFHSLCSPVFLLDCLWNTLDFEVNLKLLLFLVRHGSPRTGSTLMRIVALKLSDTESFQFLFVLTTLSIQSAGTVVKDNGIGSSLPKFDPINGIRELFPLVLVVYLSWL